MDGVSNIVLLQTADSERYLPMLQATAPVNQAYCARHKISYSQFIGIKRGYHPWQACFNRIILIKEMIDAGFRGWLFYLDADAYVFDLSFDVRDLIAKIAKPIIMSLGGPTGEPWDVNNGVFLVDLSDESARDLMSEWYHDFLSTSDEILRATTDWDSEQSDQPRLQRILREQERFYDHLGLAEGHVLNDDKGSFVRQILRAHAATWEERLERIRKEADEILGAAALSEKVKQYTWHHSIDLGGGIITPGGKAPSIHAAESAAFFDPIKMTGTSVIDIGAWNGFYSFEAKRRGAGRVLATDHFCWNQKHFRGRETFDLARSVLGLDVEALDIDVPELCAEKVGGTFDVVLFLGVFYHLFDPIDGLRRAASLAKEVLVIETHTDLGNMDRPAMVMYPGSELNNDATNWWGPNNACMYELLKTMGFTRIDGPTNFSPRAVFHAWRSTRLKCD